MANAKAVAKNMKYTQTQISNLTSKEIPLKQVVKISKQKDHEYAEEIQEYRKNERAKRDSRKAQRSAKRGSLDTPNKSKGEDE